MPRISWHSLSLLLCSVTSLHTYPTHTYRLILFIVSFKVPSLMNISTQKAVILLLFLRPLGWQSDFRSYLCKNYLNFLMEPQNCVFFQSSFSRLSSASQILIISVIFLVLFLFELFLYPVYLHSVCLHSVCSVHVYTQVYTVFETFPTSFLILLTTHSGVTLLNGSHHCGKISERHNLSEKRFISAHGFRVQLMVTGDFLVGRGPLW